MSPEGKGANQPQFRSMATGLHEVPQLVTESKNITVTEASSSTGTKLANFITKVEKAKTSGRYPLAQIGNMDETPMYFDLGPSRTIERMGAKEVLVRTTGADKKAPNCCLDGDS